MTEESMAGLLLLAPAAASYVGSVAANLSTELVNGVRASRSVERPESPALDRLKELSSEAFPAMIRTLPRDATVGSFRRVEQSLYVFLADQAVTLPLIVAEYRGDKILPEAVRNRIRDTDPKIALGISFESVVHSYAHAIRDLLDTEGLNEPDSPLLAWLSHLCLRFPNSDPSPPRLPLPLDAAPADFVGREKEEAELLAALGGGESRAICAIGGMGGIGKTALAVRVAHQLADQYPDGQYQIDLQGFSETEDPLPPRDAMARLIGAFDPGIAVPEKEKDALAVYRGVLARKKAFILLDNAADTAQTRPLVTGQPCTFLVTSRKNIALDGHAPINLDALSEPESLKLLRGLLGEERASDEELADLVEVCARLPLALRAAAAYLNVYGDATARAYVDDLRAERAKLGADDDPALDVRNILGWSARRLAQENADWHARWGMWSVFPAPFDLAAAAAVCDTDEEETRAMLRELHARNLLLHEAETGRYRLHDLMRNVARDALTRGGSQEEQEDVRLAAERRHAAHYVKVLFRADSAYQKGGDRTLRGLATADGEWDNILAAQRWAAKHAKDDVEAMRLCSDYPDAGVHILNLRLNSTKWIDWLQLAVDAARRLGDRLMQSVHLGNLGTAYASLGDGPNAIEFLEQALLISREVNDRRGERAKISPIWAVLTSFSGDVLGALRARRVLREGYGKSHAEGRDRKGRRESSRQSGQRLQNVVGGRPQGYRVPRTGPENRSRDLRPACRRERSGQSGQRVRFAG